jgi:hypothetical protein
MGYSLRIDDPEISEMPGNLHISHEDWNRYPFVSREDLQFGRDYLKELVDAFRKEGAIINLYIDPGSLENTDIGIKLTMPGLTVR